MSGFIFLNNKSHQHRTISTHLYLCIDMQLSWDHISILTKLLWKQRVHMIRVTLWCICCSDYVKLATYTCVDRWKLSWLVIMSVLHLDAWESSNLECEKTSGNIHNPCSERCGLKSRLKENRSSLSYMLWMTKKCSMTFSSESDSGCHMC